MESARPIPAGSFCESKESSSSICHTHRRKVCKKATKKHILGVSMLTLTPAADKENSALSNNKFSEALRKVMAQNAELEGKIAAQENLLKDGKIEIEEKKALICGLTRELDAKNESLKALKNASREKTQSMEIRTEELKSRAQELAQKETLLSSKLAENQATRQKLSAEKQALANLLSELSGKEQNLNSRENELREVRDLLRQKERVLSEKEEVQGQIRENLKTRQREMEKLRAELEEKGKLAEEKETELEEREFFIQNQLRIVENLDLKVLGLKMNEELWMKKKELQNKALINGFVRLKDKERELKERAAMLRAQQSVRKSNSNGQQS